MKKFKKIHFWFPLFTIFFISLHSFKIWTYHHGPSPILNLSYHYISVFLTGLHQIPHWNGRNCPFWSIYVCSRARAAAAWSTTTFLRTFDFSFSWLEEARRWNYLKWKIFLICSGKSLFLLFFKILKVAWFKKDSSNHILEFLRYLICSNNFKFKSVCQAWQKLALIIFFKVLKL